MLKQLFRSRPEVRQAEALYARVVDQARQPAFYTALATPDRHSLVVLDELPPPEGGKGFP